MSFLALLWAGLALAQAEPADAGIPAARGVQIEKRAGDKALFSQGSGVYLGNGLVLTAAHVVTINKQDPTLSVILDGWRVDGKVAAVAPAPLDLALVKIDPAALSKQRREMPALPVCEGDTKPNQPVVVVAQGALSLSQTVGGPIRSDALNGDWRDILATGYHHGASGGGIYDAGSGCLRGIIIIEASNGAVDLTQFLPPAKIVPFLTSYH